MADAADIAPQANNMDEKSPLEKLNDDCIDYIFQFLEMPDVVHLNLVSNRFRDFAKRWIMRWIGWIPCIPNQEIIDYCELTNKFRSHRLPDIKIRGFIAIYGDDMKRVRTLCTNEYNDILADCCSSIEYLKVDYRSKVKRSWWSFIGRMQSLRSLFIDCTGTKQYHEKQYTGAIDEIAKLHNLECLRIHNARITGNRLNELTNLRELDLWNCFAIDNQHFINAYRANPNLTKINIGGCRFINSTAYRCMAEDSRLIESLEFDAHLLNREFLPGLNHLKHLTIHNLKPSTFGDILLKEYSNACGETLMSLTCYYWREFSIPESVIFPNLIELSVNLGCCTDVVLRSLCNSCPRLEKLTVVDTFENASQKALLDFFRQSKSVVFACLEIWHCFSVSLYKEIVEVRRTFSDRKTLKLVVYGLWPNAKYEEINSFMKGNDYAALQKFVEIDFQYEKDFDL